MKVGQIFKELEERFKEDTDDVQFKLKNALIFEANVRLMKHPYDLIGLRRLKLFEDSLKNYLKYKGKGDPNDTCQESLMEKMSQCFNLNGRKQRIFKVFKIVAVVALVTLIVNVNDYFQDIRVICTFWLIGYNGHTLDDKNTNEFQAILLLKFYPPAMFLTVVTIFSTFQIVFHLPSLWYRFKVSMQMESPACELGREIIDPKHVVNQYNLPISESKNEAIWQMMVQWGQYFCLSWYVTWRLKISDFYKGSKELQEVDELLKFSTLFPSLLSSVCSLTYGQFVTHSITYKYRTSGVQKFLYMWSCSMITMCNMFILLVWQTAIKDRSIGYHIMHESSFNFDDSTVFIISLMLLTPFLYKYMVLPPSTKEYTSSSMKTPRFLHGVIMQCFVFSFFLGLSAFVNSRLYIWGPEVKPSLPWIAYKITDNETYLGIFNHLSLLL
jgi:hypothetical protein